MNKKRIALIAIVAVLVGSFVFLYSKGWIHKTFEAGEVAIGVLSEAESQEPLAYIPDDPDAGVIFYPGGMVDYLAYAPLMEKLESQNIAAIMLKTKTGLPMFESGLAEGVKDEYPNIDKWYIAGHSMGGIAAASFLAEHPEDFEGLILLASYTTKDISDLDKKALLIYGTEDGVMNHEMYEENKGLLPSYEEYIIEGGCHSYFADYGLKGEDTKPSISPQKQWTLTAGKIVEFVNRR